MMLIAHFAFTISEGNKRPCVPGYKLLAYLQAFQKKYLYEIGKLQLSYDRVDTVKR